MKKWSQKTKFRVTFIVVGLIASLVFFSSTLFSFLMNNYKYNSKKKELNESYNEKLAEEEELKSDIEKLQDPEYLARYAREKYLYSGEDELIIKFEE